MAPMMVLSRNPEDHADASILQLELDRSEEAPALARAAVTAFCSEHDIDPKTLATLTLLVSEIVTNAVLHPDVEQPTKIRLFARIEQGTIRVKVTDHGSGFTPTPRDPAQIRGGYGLHVLHKEASRWGVDVDGDTTVWFELAKRATDD
jgi:anti-sigma regulatory factor (Ser/Thr protein kinase)